MSGFESVAAQVERNDAALSPNLVNTQVRRGIGTEMGPPAHVLPDDRVADQRVQLKRDLVEGHGIAGGAPAAARGMGPFGVIMQEKEDVEYLQRKRRETEGYLFDNWYGQFFDLKDISELRLAEQINPDWFRKREQVLDEMSDIQKRYAKIKLRGPKDLKDMHLIYAIMRYRHSNAGRTPPILTESVYNFDKVQIADSYVRGIFNPFKSPVIPNITRDLGMLGNVAGESQSSALDPGAAGMIGSWETGLGGRGNNWGSFVGRI